eukprot:scaffold4044_cov399-Prasinococcus_capsulatus_cf.AAC.1
MSDLNAGRVAHDGDVGAGRQGTARNCAAAQAEALPVAYRGYLLLARRRKPVRPSGWLVQQAPALRG